MRRHVRTLFILAIVLAVGFSALQIVSTPRRAQAAGNGDPAKSSVTPAGPVTVNANGVDTATVTIQILQSDGVTPVIGDQINILTSPSPLPAGVSVTPGLSGLTDNNGRFVVTVKSTQVGLITLNPQDVSSGNFQVGSSQINFVAPPATDAQSTITANPANPTAVPADGVSSATITVTLNDAGGHPTANKAVTLTASPNTGVDIQPSPPQLTNGAGTVVFTVRSTTPNLVTFTATDTSDGVTLTHPGPAQVNFVAPPASATNSTVSASKSNVDANGVDKATISVTVKDAGNHTLANRAVTLTSSSLSVTITPTSGGQTDANGVATFDVTTTQPQNNVTFQASSGGITINQTAVVNFLTAPAVAANSTVSSSAATLPADNFTTATITVTLNDAGNHPAVGKTVSLSSSLGGVNIVANNNGVTNASGVATFTVKSPVVGSATFTATDTTDNVVLSAPAQKPTINFTAPPADAAQSLMGRIPGAGDIPGDNTTVVQIIVTLRDAGGNPVPGKQVQLTATPGAGITITPTAAGADTTNASGVATFNVKALVTTPTLVNITAKDVPDNVTINSFQQVNFVPAPANNALSTVVANPTSVVADNLATSTVTVTLKDQGSNPLQGKTVSLAASANGTGVSINPATAVTNASGVVTFTVKSTTPHQVPPTTFTATDVTDGNLVLTNTANVTFTTSPAAVGNSTIAAVPATVVANGGATTAGQSVITLTLADAGGNPTAGKTIQLVPSPSTGVVFVSGNTLGTDASGQVQFTVGSTIAQGVTFTANDLTDNISPFKTVSVTFTASSGPVDGTKSTLSASPTTLNADGTATSTITATLKDQFGTAVQGKTVTLTPTPNPLPAGFTLSAASGPSDAAGVVTWTLKSTVGGTVSFTGAVTSDGVILQGNPTITFNPVGSPVSATNSTVTASGSPAPADNTSPITVTVTLLDSANAPVANKTVTLTSSRGATDTIAPASATTNASGVATFTVKSSTAGTAQLTAVGDGITLNQKPNITFNPLGSPVSANNSTVLISASPLTADGVSKFTITVTARDAANNPVPNVGATVTSTRPGNVDTITPLGFQNTDASGQATFFMTSLTPGTGNVVAVVDGITLAQSPSFTWNPTVSPVDPAQSTVTASGSPAPADGVSPITVTVTLKNSVGNPVGGKTVSISGSPAGLNITPASAVSDAVTGAATFTVRSTTAAGFQITAVGDGVTLNQKPTITFTPVAPTPNLAITKAGLVSNVNAGQTNVQLYTITLNNNGGAGTTGNIQVTDTLPTGLTLASASSAPAGFTCSGTTSVTCTSSTPIAQNGTVTITLTVDVALSASGSVQNTASVSGGGAPNATSNTVTTTITGAPANLQIAKSHTGNFFAGQTNASYLITVTNVGAGAASGPITFTDNLPLGMTLSTYTSVLGSWTCSGSTTVTCTSPGPISGNGGISQVRILVNTPIAGGPISNTANLTAPNAATGTDILQTVVSSQPDLSGASVSISANPSTNVNADNSTTSTITVNVTKGGLPMGGVPVNISVTPSGATVSGQVNTDNNGNATFTIKSSTATTYTITPTFPTSINVPSLPTTTVQFVTPTATATPNSAQATSTAAAAVASGSSNPQGSTVTVDCTTVPADNVYKANITVTLRNSSGGAVPSKNVSITSSPALTGLVITPTQGVSDTNGQVKFTAQSPTQGGPITFTATNTSDNITIGTVQVTFGKPGTQAVCPAPSTTGAGGLPATSLNLLNVPLDGPGIGQVIPYRLRVRTGPGLQFPQIGTLQGKQLVTLLGRDSRGRWFLIRLQNGGVGWVSAFYIRVRRLAFRHLPVVDQTQLILPIASAPGVAPTATPTR